VRILESQLVSHGVLVLQTWSNGPSILPRLRGEKTGFFTFVASPGKTLPVSDDKDGQPE
jgi:hypothetical protein